MRVAWIVLVCGLFWQGFAQTGIDYALPLGSCEIDENGDGFTDGWLRWHRQINDINWSNEGISFTLSRSVKLDGERSQEIRIARSQGSQGSFIIELRPIWSVRMPYIMPPAGTPLLVRGWLRTENLQNVSIQVRITTGQRTIRLADIQLDTSGWMPVSAVVPLETNSNGEVQLYFTVEVSHGAGAASGRIWIDGVQVLWTGFSPPVRPRPNMLKIAHYNAPVPHWQMLLSPPVDFLIAPLPHSKAVADFLPGTPTAVYVNAAQTSSSQPTPFFDLYGGYQYVLANHPNWFLRRDGQPFANPGYPDLWPLDIGLPAVRQRAIERLNAISEAVPLPEWIFFDNAGSWWQCDQYPTRQSVLPIWTGYFQTVFTHVRQQLGRKVAINAGSHVGAFIDGNEGTNWIQYVDCVMLEHVIVFLGGTPRTFRYQNYRLNRATSPHTDSTWWATLRAINAHPSKKWIIVAMNHPNVDLEMFRYILASYFVMAHENTYLMVEARETGESNLYHLWVNRPEVWVPLGTPRGSWRVAAGTANDASGALFARDFEYGIVLVNPTESQTYEYTLPHSYKNWDGQVLSAGTRLQIGPKTGVALYAAPEVVISLSPQQVTALPGETVTFTVQYRNNGLVDATNVKISVPLPEGLEFVSSSTGGQYLNRQISWTLPQVRVGQSGTLTFQARVQ